MSSREPITCLITKGEATPENFSDQASRITETVKLAVVAEISYVQLREKRISSRQLFELALLAASVTKGSNTKLLVNGRLDIAIAAGANGVHLPEDGVPVAALRAQIGSRFIIGASVHSLESALDAKKDGADFVIFGPVFDSSEKKGVGVDNLAEICDEMGDFPVIAVGGIERENAADVLKNGAAGYAAIRYLNEAVKSDLSVPPAVSGVSKLERLRILAAAAAKYRSPRGVPTRSEPQRGDASERDREPAKRAL